MDKQFFLNDKRECCGCGVCMQICPTSAISMKEDEEGFLYPSIDESKCINCKKCEKVCAFSNKKRMLEDNCESICYVAKHRDTNIRMNSRSGGIFVACSDWILSMGGVVYGSVLNEALEAVCIRACNKEQRNKMCKSKYVQSEICDIYSELESDLKDGKMVLFSGTGCQVDGILHELDCKQIDRSRLYTIEIVCHGCPSPKLFSDYIQYLQEKNKGKVTEFEFRDKELCGWDGHIESYRINDGKKKKSIIWREIFNSNLALRPSCYNCKYVGIKQVADIKIADAWGIKKIKPEFNDNRGVSLFFISGEKGDEMFEIIKKSCQMEEMTMTEPMKVGPLRSPSKPNGDRNAFWETYNSAGIKGVIKHYATKRIGYRIKKCLKYKIRKLLLGRKYYLP